MMTDHKSSVMQVLGTEYDLNTPTERRRALDAYAKLVNDLGSVFEQHAPRTAARLVVTTLLKALATNVNGSADPRTIDAFDKALDLVKNFRRRLRTTERHS